VILCDASNPGMDGDVYHVPYNEAVDGYRHAYATKHKGVQWSRSMDHPADPRCPGCAEIARISARRGRP
jgi:hypothetical protein